MEEINRVICICCQAPPQNIHVKCTFHEDRIEDGVETGQFGFDRNTHLTHVLGDPLIESRAHRVVCRARAEDGQCGNIGAIGHGHALARYYILQIVTPFRILGPGITGLLEHLFCHFDAVVAAHAHIRLGYICIVPETISGGHNRIHRHHRTLQHRIDNEFLIDDDVRRLAESRVIHRRFAEVKGKIEQTIVLIGVGLQAFTTSRRLFT